MEGPSGTVVSCDPLYGELWQWLPGKNAGPVSAGNLILPEKLEV